MKRFVLAVVLAMLDGACGDDVRGLASTGPDGGSGDTGGNGGGSGSGSGSDSGSGGGSDGSGGTTTARITVVTTEPPALIAFRAEASTRWQTPAGTRTGTFEFDIDGPYRVVVVCDSPTGASVTELAQTIDDDHQIAQRCAPQGTSPFRVTGQVLQPAEFYLGDAFDGATSAPWSFSLATAAGTFDLFEFFGTFSGGDNRFAIRRDLAITGDLDLGTIDAATEQIQQMTPAEFIPTNLAADETLDFDLLLSSGNTSVLVAMQNPSPSTWQINRVPDAALRSTDEQDVDLIAGTKLNDLNQLFTRTFSRVVRDGSPKSVTLMDRLGPTTLEHTADRLVVTWSSPLPAFDGVDIARSSFSGDASIFVSHDLMLTRRFIAATGATSATLDFTDVPGFKPEWGHDRTFEQMIGIHVFLGTFPNESSDASLQQLLPPPAPSGGAAQAPTAQPLTAQRLAAQRAKRFAAAHRARLLGASRASRSCRGAGASMARCP
jgi:hypothetical protein